MPKTRFRTISLPRSYFRKIDKYIEQSNGFYVSAAEVVREALREYFTDKNHLTHTVKRPVRDALH
jgi:Arc/MetJ-type ribon-helix-helix transcriptional regulator